jgi:quaternary ammonium compound-resistance protein SugE
MAWIALFLAGLMEVGWAIGLKYLDGTRRPWVALGVLAALGGSLFLLTYAQRTLPLGTAYAVWVGIGAMGAALAGIVLFGESTSGARLFFLATLLASVIGLKWTS